MPENHKNSVQVCFEKADTIVMVMNYVWIVNLKKRG